MAMTTIIRITIIRITIITTTIMKGWIVVLRMLTIQNIGIMGQNRI
jgi:hypothetical protein